MVLQRKREMHGFDCWYCDHHLFRPKYKETNGEDCNDYCELDGKVVLSSGGGCQYCTVTCKSCRI